MTYEDKASYDSTPPCIYMYTHINMYVLLTHVDIFGLLPDTGMGWLWSVGSIK